MIYLPCGTSLLAFMFSVSDFTQELLFNIPGLSLLHGARLQALGKSRIPAQCSFSAHPRRCPLTGTYGFDLDFSLWLSDWQLLYLLLEHFNFPLADHGTFNVRQGKIRSRH